jgi:hypothetical protein
MRYTSNFLRGLLIASLAGLPIAAQALDNGQYGGVPDNVRSWFKSVRSPHGVPCCDISDGHRTAFDMRPDGYYVPIEGEWRPRPSCTMPVTPSVRRWSGMYARVPTRFTSAASCPAAACDGLTAFSGSVGRREYLRWSRGD